MNGAVSGGVPFLSLQRICGMGIDIVEISRIREKINNNRAFLKRVFTDEELKYSLGKKNQYQRLAVRFAAKEAVWKAVGLKGLALKDIAIVKAPGGQPGIACRDARAAGLRFQLSLTHSNDYAAAIVIAMREADK
ncbi:MAG: holo-ACP synthase [Elusimicrobia bacterium]|nr:holo-ACP synthase [Elusimicrobiota bacterium]